MSEAREGRLDDAAELVEVVAYLELFMHPECYADLADMGVDVTLYDELTLRPRLPKRAPWQ